MIYRIELFATAIKQLRTLNKTSRQRILAYLERVVLRLDNPRDAGTALKGNLGGLWRYRVGDYRIICEIQDNKFLVCVIQIGHRRDIYKG